MSEKERWIVYPLIFFALGAAIRDKLLQRVEAKEIYCESLHVIDLQNPGQPLASLALLRNPASEPAGVSSSMGTLELVDSSGTVLCQIKKDSFIESLETNLAQTQELRVLDPHGHPLVKAATEETPSAKKTDEAANAPLTHQGVIILNDERVQAGIKIAPPQAGEPQPKSEQPQTATPGE